MSNTNYKDNMKSYINLLFDGYDMTDEMLTLRSEMYQNLCDKFDDMIKDGVSPQEAYRNAINSVGDINEIITESNNAHFSDSGKNTSEAFNGNRGTYRESEEASTTYKYPSKEALETYKGKKALITTLSVVLYILCIVPILLIDTEITVTVMFLMIAAATGMIIYISNIRPVAIPINEDEEIFLRTRKKSAFLIAFAVASYICSVIFPILLSNTVGVVLFLSVIALATGILIYNGITKKKIKYTYAHDEDDKADKKDKRPAVLSAVLSAIWLLTIAFYIFISFMTMRWDITWICFLIAVAICNLVTSIYDYINNKKL